MSELLCLIELDVKLVGKRESKECLVHWQLESEERKKSYPDWKSILRGEGANADEIKQCRTDL